MAQIVDGKEIAGKILEDLKKRVRKLKALGIEPALAVVLVGKDKPSMTYVRKKGEAAGAIGLAFFKYEIEENISKEELLEKVKRVQSEHDLSGLIVQLPLPAKFREATREIVNQIGKSIDVDCLTYDSLGKVMMGKSLLAPPTPGAIMEVLKHYRVDLKGKSVCLIGRGDLIGKPLASMLQNEPVTLITCGKSTPDISVFTRKADVIITGVGKKDLLTGEMVKEGAVVIDAGVCFEESLMYGDIDFESVARKASLVTPTPGGVGPITVAKLLENTVLSAEQRVR